MLLSDIEKKEIDFYINHFDFFDFFKNKTFLITGYRGLIGTGIVKWLLRLNHLRGANIRLILSSRNSKLVPMWLQGDDLKYVSFSDFMNESAVCFPNVDFIIHLSAPTDKQYFVTNPIETIDSIYNGTKFYLDFAKKYKNIKFLYASSVEIYGCPQSAEPLEESFCSPIDSLNIRNGYPIGKKAAEFLCLAYFKNYGLNTFIVRPSSVQGLFQRYDETRIFNEILRCLIEKRDFIMKSSGETKKSIIYSLDTVSAIFSILCYGNPGEAYNITNPNIYLTMSQYVNKLFSHFNYNLKLIFESPSENEAKSFLPKVEYNLSIEKLRKIGWEPLSDLIHIYEVDMERFKER